jgi:hypothetical protein
MPINRRASSSIANEVAMPDMNEHSEKATIATSSGALRLPVRSEIAPPNSPASAQVNDRLEATMPTCV